MSYGSGGYGSAPWGGGGAPPLPSAFNLFCFQHCDSMSAILADPDVSTVDAGSQFLIDVPTCDLKIRSGGAFSTADARLYVSANVPDSWTLEFTILAEDLPNDFSNLVDSHLFVDCTDAAGVCAGLFISKTGLAYAGSVHHDGVGNMVLDSAIQFLPDSSSLIVESEYLIFRIAADLTTEAVYIYVTKSSEIGVTGHQLRYILPAIKATDLAFPATDQVTVSIRGTAGDATLIDFDSLCLGFGLIIPNLPPIADAGEDQAIRTCDIALLDGTASFDPEGAFLTYDWRLIDAPTTSSFVFEGFDGATFPLGVPTGFTDKFHSDSLGDLPVDELPQVGDVLLLDAIAYDIVGSGTDVDGFFVQIASESIPDNFSTKSFKILRQNAISTATSSKATFFPDVPGLFKFDLIVGDGSLLSESDAIIVNVLESAIPKGCIPNLGFIWNYLSDFWSLVEDRERIETFFQALVQVAASELLNLWQIDYSKSLRDIQRTVQRRWLHYDLLLAEPIPELTRFRKLHGGVTSSGLDPAGESGLIGSSLIIESPLFEEPLEHMFFGSDPLLPSQIEAQLVAFFSRDPRFSVVRFENHSPPAGSSLEYVRIIASIPFSISDSSTVSIFTVGDENSFPSGSTGFSLGFRTYKVNRSLFGLDIQKGDLLHISNQSFSIDRIVDSPDDELPFQRVILESDLPLVPGSEWSVSGWCTSRLLDFYNGLVSKDDVVTLEVTNDTTRSFALIETTALGVSELEPGKLGLDLSVVDQYLAQPEYVVRLARVNRRRYVPIDDLIVDVPSLQEFIESSEQAVLRRNVDFFIEEFREHNSIRFVVPNSPTADVWEGQKPPDRMWSEITFVDNRPAIEANFGIPAEFTLDDLESVASSLDYLSAVRGLWYAYLKGPKIKNLRVGAQILLGLPFAEEPGVIEEIRNDFSPTKGRILMRDSERTEIVRSYTFPKLLGLEINPQTGVKYKVGDSVAQFEPLVEGAEVVDWIKNPRWFEGLLHQGSFFEVEKFHRFLVRVDSAAFSLDTLQFVQRFILRIKPTYTHPLFDVLFQVEDTEGSEVSVTDDVELTGRLFLYDGTCNLYGVAPMWDEPNPSGGGFRSQYDTDGDPNTAPPTHPTPDVTVEWGFDKNFLCPYDAITWNTCQTFDGVAAINSDTTFPFGSLLDEVFVFTTAAATSIPAPPGGLTITPVGTNVIGFTGTIDVIRLLIGGTPGADPRDYELVVALNAVDVATFPFTVTDFGFEIDFSTNIGVAAADTVTVRVRPDSGVVGRTTNWTAIRVELVQIDVLTWTNLAVPPAGHYCLPIVLVP